MSLRDLLFGRPLATHEEGEQRVGPVAGIPMLGLDALASAAYGPEAAMTLLIPLGALGLGYIGPIIDYVFKMRDENPDRQIAVLVPELVAFRWYHHVLHNKRASMLKALLFLRGDENIVVINVPWYLSA